MISLYGMLAAWPAYVKKIPAPARASVMVISLKGLDGFSAACLASSAKRRNSDALTGMAKTP